MIEVFELRQHVAQKMKTVPEAVTLLHGDQVLQDRTRVSTLFIDTPLSALLLDHPLRWYPIGKYMHEQKEVLMIVMASHGFEKLSGDNEMWRSMLWIHYRDGSVHHPCNTGGWLRFPPEVQLVRRFNFVSYICEFKTSRMHGLSKRIRIQAVPREDTARPTADGIATLDSDDLRILRDQHLAW
jgi:hypothetical protein